MVMDIISRYQPTNRFKYLVVHFLRGLRDCVWGILAIKDFDPNAGAQRRRRRYPEPKNLDKSVLKKRLLQCFVLNGVVFGFTFFIFNEAFLPCIRYLLTFVSSSPVVVDSAWSYVSNVLWIIFGFLWVIPLFLLSRLINFLWFQDIADLTYEIPTSVQNSVGIGYVLADMLGSFCVQVIYLVQSAIFYNFPYATIGYPLHIVHSCLLYSLYAFEYKWIKSGIQLNQRLAHIEWNWTYFLGFGMPLTLLTSFVDSHIISICIFSVFFPAYIISGNNTKPPPTVSLYSCRLPIFTLAMSLSDFIFCKLSRIFRK